LTLGIVKKFANGLKNSLIKHFYSYLAKLSFNEIRQFILDKTVVLGKMSLPHHVSLT